MLEMGLLESVQSVYDFRKGRFDQDRLETLMSQFDKLYDSFPLLPILLRQMLVFDQVSRFSFRKIKKALPNWDELEMQFSRESQLINDFCIRGSTSGAQYLQIPCSKEALHISSKVSVSQNTPSERTRRDVPYPSSFSNHISSSSRRTNRVSSRRNHTPGNPLQIQITPEKLRRTRPSGDPLSRTQNQLSTQRNEFIGSQNDNELTPSNFGSTRQDQAVSSRHQITSQVSVGRSSQNLPPNEQSFALSQPSRYESRVSGSRAEHTPSRVSTTQPVGEHSKRGFSEIDRISQNLFKITRVSKKQTSRLSLHSNGMSQTNAPNRDQSSLLMSQTRTAQAVRRGTHSVRNRSRKTHSSNLKKIFEDPRSEIQKVTRQFSRSHISPGRSDIKRIRFNRRSYNPTNRRVVSRVIEHPLQKQIKMSDTLISEQVKTQEVKGIRGLGQQLLKDIQGIFTKKKPESEQMNYKQIMKMRKTSQLWEDEHRDDGPGKQSYVTVSKGHRVRDYLRKVQVSHENNDFAQPRRMMPGPEARPKRTGLGIKLSNRPSRSILIKKKVIRRVPRMSNQKPKPVVEMEENSKTIYVSPRQSTNRDWESKRSLEKLRGQGPGERKQSQDRVIVLRRQPLRSKKSDGEVGDRQSRRPRSSSVFSEMKRKTEKSARISESNGSRVSSYSRRKNRFAEKSSEKKPRKSSKIKVKYTQPIKNLKKLRLPPTRKSCQRKENIRRPQSRGKGARAELESLDLNRLSQKKEAMRSPLSSHRANRKLRSDRVSSVQFKIACSKSNLENGSVESQESVICDISSFREAGQGEDSRQWTRGARTRADLSRFKLSDKKQTRFAESHSKIRLEKENTGHTEKLKFTKPLQQVNMDQMSSRKSNRKLKKQSSSRNEMFLFDDNGRLVREELFGNIQSAESVSSRSGNSDQFKFALEQFLKRV